MPIWWAIPGSSCRPSGPSRPWSAGASRPVETVDGCLGRIVAAVGRAGGGMIVTADHGNAEMMIDPVTGGPHTYHTTNPVPFLLMLPNGPGSRADRDQPAHLRQGG